MMNKISSSRHNLDTSSDTILNATPTGVEAVTIVRPASDNLDCDYKTMPHSREWFSANERTKLAQSALKLIETKSR